jgi:hypothetical protein
VPCGGATTARTRLQATPDRTGGLFYCDSLTDPESARWGAFWNATQRDGGPLVCGAVNAKNQMGGYIGMTGLTFEPKVDRAILLFSGRTDGDAGIAISLYRAYCLSDPGQISEPTPTVVIFPRTQKLPK